MLEHEMKRMLSKESYEELLQHEALSKLKQVKQLQINYYYDTKNHLLYDNDITLRIRQINDQLKLEIKFPVEDNGAYKIKREYAEPITELPLSIDLDHRFQDVAPNEQAFLIQPLITERTRIQVTDHIQFDLDKSSYLGVTDYELEIEFQEESYDEAKLMYEQLFGDSTEEIQTKGKKSRFFKRYFDLHTKWEREGGNPITLYSPMSF